LRSHCRSKIKGATSCSPKKIVHSLREGGGRYAETIGNTEPKGGLSIGGGVIAQKKTSTWKIDASDAAHQGAKKGEETGWGGSNELPLVGGNVSRKGFSVSKKGGGREGEHHMVGMALLQEKRKTHQGADHGLDHVGEGEPTRGVGRPMGSNVGGPKRY